MPDITQIVFFILTIFTIGGAIGVVTSRTLFHSALYLILSLFGVAGYYVLLSAGFLAVVQLMLYIGAVDILILFAIMFSRQVMAPAQSQLNRQWWVSLIMAVVLLVVLVVTVNSVQWPLSEAQPSGNTVEQLGLAFLGSYLIPFEVIGILLSAALIGAVILAREKTEAEETES
jgi:NADH-quinone oxidoreductase subunit J